MAGTSKDELLLGRGICHVIATLQYHAQLRTENKLKLKFAIE